MISIADVRGGAMRLALLFYAASLVCVGGDWPANTEENA